MNATQKAINAVIALWHLAECVKELQGEPCEPQSSEQ
jgi:hypothetical protein